MCVSFIFYPAALADSSLIDFPLYDRILSPTTMGYTGATLSSSESSVEGDGVCMQLASAKGRRGQHPSVDTLKLHPDSHGVSEAPHVFPGAFVKVQRCCRCDAFGFAFATSKGDTKYEEVKVFR